MSDICSFVYLSVDRGCKDRAWNKNRKEFPCCPIPASPEKIWEIVYQICDIGKFSVAKTSQKKYQQIEKFRKPGAESDKIPLRWIFNLAEHIKIPHMGQKKYEFSDNF